MLSGYPLFRRIELMFSSSCCSLLFEQIINAQCTSVSIKLVLRFVGPNESQRKYCPFTFCWDLFGPTKRKTNLIDTLVHRALMICSKSKLQHELENISSILRNNGYPESIIQITTSKKIVLFDRLWGGGIPKLCQNICLLNIS